MRCELIRSELDVPADFNEAAPASFTESFTKGWILRSGVPNPPDGMIEDIQHLCLHSELHPLRDRNSLCDREIAIRYKRVVAPEPVARTH